MLENAEKMTVTRSYKIRVCKTVVELHPSMRLQALASRLEAIISLLLVAMPFAPSSYLLANFN